MQWKVLASLMLASALVTGQAQTSTGSTAKAASTKTSAKRKKTAPKVTKPSIESQIQQLREEMQTQIQGLKQQLADRDSQLQAAKSQAAAAQAALRLPNVSMAPNMFLNPLLMQTFGLGGLVPSAPTSTEALTSPKEVSTSNGMKRENDSKNGNF